MLQSYDGPFQHCDTTSGSAVTPFSVKDILNMNMQQEGDFFPKKDNFGPGQQQFWDGHYYSLSEPNANCYYNSDDTVNSYNKSWTDGSYSDVKPHFDSIQPMNSMYSCSMYHDSDQTDPTYAKIESPSKYFFQNFSSKHSLIVFVDSYIKLALFPIRCYI